MDLYGLIGYPLGHSFSEKYFTEKFQKEGINATYKPFPIQCVSELMEIIALNPNLRGLSVTSPHKESLYPYLNELHPSAKLAGAVNAIKIERKGNNPYLTGFNTDIYGFIQSLKEKCKELPTSALVLGTGGAAKAVLKGLESINISAKFVSRTPKDSCTIAYDNLSETEFAEHKLVVNATPLGMLHNPNELPPINYDFLTANHYLFDLIYNPAETAFLKEGRLRGAKTQNGLEMLHLQAEKAWEYFNE